MPAAKAEQKLPLDGQDVWPTLTAGQAVAARRDPAQHDAERRGDPRRRLEAGRHERRRRPGRRPAEEEGGKESVELFNLKDDPYEKTNLAEKQPEKVKELQGKLAAFAKQAVPPKAKPKPKDFVTPKVWGEKDDSSHFGGPL